MFYEPNVMLLLLLANYILPLLNCYLQNDYQNMIVETDSQEGPGDNVSGHQSDDIIVSDVGRVDEKEHIYLGPEAMAIISNLSAENTILQKKLKTYELIPASNEELRLV
jgi:hypothetical protein